MHISSKIQYYDWIVLYIHRKLSQNNLKQKLKVNYHKNVSTYINGCNKHEDLFLDLCLEIKKYINIRRYSVNVNKEIYEFTE